MAHAAGPWGVRLIEGKYRVYPSGQPLGMTFAVVDADRGEDAALIAAAPDLRAACEAALKDSDRAPDASLEWATIELLKAAIAKAGAR